MTLDIERRILQLIVAVACLVPLSAATMSIWEGPEWVRGTTGVPIDLDSHFRYLSGIFLAMGIGFASCVPRIESRGNRFRLLGALVVTGGLARLFSLATVGRPSDGHMIGLGIELVVVPLLLIWQYSLASRWRRLRMPVV